MSRSTSSYGRLDLDVVHRILEFSEVAADLLDLALERHPAPDGVDAAATRDGYEPGARVVRDA